MTAFLIALVVFGIACLVSKINKENEFQEKRRLEKTDVALHNKITKEVRTKVLQDLILIIRSSYMMLCSTMRWLIT